MPKPIRHIIILAHPDPASFNAAIALHYAETVRAAGHEAMIRDLYALGFDPLLKNSERPGRSGFTISPDVRDELALIRDADVYVFVYPIWFGMPPAILTGYVDRVIGSGVTAREVQGRAGQGVLRGKDLLTISTSGASDIWLDEQGQIESLKDLMGRYLFNAFGVRRSHYMHFGHIIEGYDRNFADQVMYDVETRARDICTHISQVRR